MCTILFSWKETPDYRLILAANRDEFYERGTKTAHWWDESPHVLGGKDLKAGGSWMGISREGRIAAITNYRKFPLKSYASSRGDLVKRFLTSREKPSDFMNFLMEEGEKYDGFNLIFGNYERLYYFSNRGGQEELNSGIYGVSNHLLDTPWPKVSKGKQFFKEKVKRGDFRKEEIFELLNDREIAPDQALPDTGIGLEKERLLSSIFIESPNYGTRLSTVLSIKESGEVEFHERSFIPRDENLYTFKIE